MSSSNSGGRGTSSRRGTGKIADKFKEACPEHKWKDLEMLVKQFKGDEEKITAKIQEWWDEPDPAKEEEEWEDVNKKSKKAARHGGGGSYRGGERGQGRSGAYRPDRDGRGGGRGFHGRGMGGGRGAGAERRSRGYADKGGRPDRDQRRSADSKKQSGRDEKLPTGVPAPVTNVPRPKGVWGQGQPTGTAHTSAADASGGPENSEQEIQITPAEDEKPPVDMELVSSQDPTPAGVVETTGKNAAGGSDAAAGIGKLPAPLVPSMATTGNVWATKGSAHLIQAEKPKPPPAPVAKRGAQKQQQLQPARDAKARKGRPSRGSKNQQPEAPHEGQAQDDEIREEKSLSVAVDSGPEEPSEEPAAVAAAVAAADVTVSAADALETSVLPPPVNGSSVNTAGWKIEQPQASSIEAAESSPAVGPISVPPGPPPINEMTVEVGVTEGSVEDSKVISAVEEPPVPSSPVHKAPVALEPVVSKQVPTSVLNMGHWETGEGDESQSLDFGFGSFGPDNDVASVDETTISSSTNNNIEVPPPPKSVPAVSAPQAVPEEASTAAPNSVSTVPTVSPARPPPGLSIGGMPPMPANAVLVHELEGKLESASLAAHKAEETSKTVESTVDTNLQPDKKPITSNFSAAQPSSYPVQTTVVVPQETATPGAIPQAGGGMSQNYMAAYGMGTYNYNAAASVPGAAGNGFVGVGPVLGIPQQQKPQPLGGGIAGQQQQSGIGTQSGAAVPQHLHQPQQTGASLYGAAPTSGSSVGAPGSDTGATSSADGSVASTAATAGLPPGMPGGIPYNPAFLYGGAQHYAAQMGQHHGGVGYGAYGYGAQFGGAGIQGGFSYQQQLAMSQSGAYGQNLYDDGGHGSHTHHSAGVGHQGGGYQKSSHGGGSGGYRGRNQNSHHSSHHSSHHNSHGGSGGYQSQYNPPQHGGYGGQPAYSMGYGVADHFSQTRGGYGPSGGMDPYGMQGGSAGYGQSGGGIGGHSSGGFSSTGGQDDPDQGPHSSKGKGKGGNARGGGFGGGNPNMQQFQQSGGQPGVQSGQQQSFGLQGGVSDSTTVTGAGTSGWSNQSWGGPSWQGS